MKRFCIALLLAVLLAAPGFATERSRSVYLAFRAHHPCPATGYIRGACPGWQVDHSRPLWENGPDAESNMQWLTVAEHRDKTVMEAHLRAALRVRFPISGH